MSGPKSKGSKKSGPSKLLIVATIVVIVLLVMAPLFTVLTVGTP